HRASRKRSTGAVARAAGRGHGAGGRRIDVRVDLVRIRREAVTLVSSAPRSGCGGCVLVPKLFTTLKDYSRRQFAADVTAGVIVGVVALPLAIAFAIASGVGPERGLYTAIIAGFLTSALGGSRVQIGGPTGAFLIIVSGIVQSHGLDGLLVATLMAGALLIALGVTRLGSAIKFIPYPVTVGFTSGIAVIIFSGQVADLLGLQVRSVPADFIEKWKVYATRLHTADLTEMAVAAAPLAI